jgi:hypothetical protein
MKREFVHIKTGELITIVQIKVGDYEMDFHKLVDTYGREWLPKHLIKISGESKVSPKENIQELIAEVADSR